MKAGSSYTYRPENSPVRPASGPAQARYNPPATSAGPTILSGKLARSYRTDQGRPLYILLDTQGQIRCYLVPNVGQNLESWVGRVVEIQTESSAYRSELRGNLVIARTIQPLN